MLPGETALAFYTATNKSDEDIIGVATYSVTPGQVAPYFSKIQCFCFEEQRLNAGETVDMPVFFFIDPDFVNDPTMNKIDTITLSYTFFSEPTRQLLEHLIINTDGIMQKRDTTRMGSFIQLIIASSVPEPYAWALGRRRIWRRLDGVQVRAKY